MFVTPNWLKCESRVPSPESCVIYHNILFIIRVQLLLVCPQRRNSALSALKPIYWFLAVQLTGALRRKTFVTQVPNTNQTVSYAHCGLLSALGKAFKPLTRKGRQMVLIMTAGQTKGPRAPSPPPLRNDNK